jgi:hypothetical protein
MLFTKFSDRKLSLTHTGNKRKRCVLVVTDSSVEHITHNVENESNTKAGTIIGMRIDPFWKFFSASTGIKVTETVM